MRTTIFVTVATLASLVAATPWAKSSTTQKSTSTTHKSTSTTSKSSSTTSKFSSTTSKSSSTTSKPTSTTLTTSTTSTKSTPSTTSTKSTSSSTSTKSTPSTTSTKSTSSSTSTKSTPSTTSTTSTSSSTSTKSTPSTTSTKSTPSTTSTTSTTTSTKSTPSTTSTTSTQTQTTSTTSACPSTSELATFDDLTTIPVLAELSPVGTYDGLTYKSFTVLQAGLAGDIITGVVPESGDQMAVSSITDSVLTGGPSFIIATPYVSFTLNSLYFGCVANSVESVLGVPEQCTVTFTAYDLAGTVITSINEQFDPSNLLLSDLALATFPSSFAKIAKVDIAIVQSTTSSLLTGLLIDNVSYELYECS